MDPMDTVRKELDSPAIVSLITNNVQLGNWIWVEDPMVADIWYLMEKEDRVILAAVYTGDDDIEISDKLVGLTE